MRNLSSNLLWLVSLSVLLLIPAYYDHVLHISSAFVVPISSNHLHHHATTKKAVRVPQHHRTCMAINNKAGDFQYIDNTNFQTVLSTDKVVLVDACAVWCGPCKLIEPSLLKIADQYKDELVLVKYDTEKESGSMGDFKMELVLQNALPTALPSLILFRDERVVDIHTGALTEGQLVDFVTPHFGDSASATTSSDKGRIHLSSAMDGADDYMLSSPEV